MKSLLTLTALLFLSLQSCFSQYIFEKTGNTPVLGVGFGRVMAGTGDMWGHQLMVDVQKRITKRSGLDFRLAGTLIEETTVFGPGFELYEKSNGVSIEADYNLFLNFARFSFYPSLGPAIRYSHERHARFVSISHDVNGDIVSFNNEIENSEPMQIGYTLGLNLDAAITEGLIFGFRASTQGFNSGDRFNFVGFTMKSVTWPF